MKITSFVKGLVARPPEPSRYVFRPQSSEMPEGWPPHYGRSEVDGLFVVTVCGVATMMPRWGTEEQARVDAWERHADDPNPEL